MEKEERYKKEIEYLRNEIKRLKGELPNHIRKVRTGGNLLSKGHVEYFISCENCKVNRARVRIRTLDIKCPSCGFSRKLSKKQINQLKKLKSEVFIGKEKSNGT